MRPIPLLPLAVVGTLFAATAAVAHVDSNPARDIPGALLKLERSADPEARRVTHELRSDAQSLPAVRRAARAEGALKTPEALQRPVPAAAENAAVEYGELAKLLTAHPIPHDQAQKIQLLSADSPPEAFSEVRAILDQHKAVLDLVHRATDKQQCVFKRDWAKGITLTFPEFPAMREGAREVRAQAILLAKDGHPADALLEERRGLALARHAASDPTAISTLLGDSTEVIALTGMEALLQIDGGNATFDDSARQMIAAYRLRPDLGRVLVGELSMADLIMEQFRREGPGSLILAENIGESVYPGLAIARQRKLEPLSPAEQRAWNEFIEANDADVIRALRTLADASGKPYARRAQVEDSLEIEGLPANLAHIFRWAMFSKVGDMDAAGVRVQATADTVMAGAAVLAYRARHQSYPNMLHQAINPEPVDPFGDEPLKYRQEPGGFAVWSIGPNGDFDGGQPGAKKPVGQTVFRFPVVGRVAS